jgi:tripartite-type tricarboxylate transporter receptor subunit TctC
MPSSLPLVKAGELRGLAVTSAKRSPAAPNIPTMAESGLPAYEATSWFAVFGPAKMPRDVVLRINQEVIRAATLPDVKEKLFQLGLDMQPGTPEALDALIQTETLKWAKVVKESGAKID